MNKIQSESIPYITALYDKVNFNILTNNIYFEPTDIVIPFNIIEKNDI